jgi:hypothetical protein
LLEAILAALTTLRGASLISSTRQNTSAHVSIRVVAATNIATSNTASNIKYVGSKEYYKLYTLLMQLIIFLASNLLDVACRSIRVAAATNNNAVSNLLPCFQLT